MNYHRILHEASNVYAVIVAFFFSILIGVVAYAQSGTPTSSNVCSMIPGNCLDADYMSKKWVACAREAAGDAKSMKITELAVENTRYGPLFTLLVSGETRSGRLFRYTANCHVSKAGELIEFKAINLR